MESLVVKGAEVEIQRVIHVDVEIGVVSDGEVDANSEIYAKLVAVQTLISQSIGDIARRTGRTAVCLI